MAEWDGGRHEEHDGGVMTEAQERVDKPPLYKVLLHNDDYTTMEFVVDILRTVFHKSALDAVRIMLAVHRQGVGVAGVYTYEIAEAKVDKVTTLARAQEFPLRCTLEED
jgi:ATP-dependent Clp protease adaptor protein ClpS